LQLRQGVGLKAYYKNFKSVSGALASATGLGPLFSGWLPATAQGYIFPPLGDATWPARFGIVVFAAAATYIAFYYPDKDSRISMAALFSISFVSLCLYLVSYMQFVRRIDISSATEIHVSIGYERTQFAKQNFDDESDWDILRARGIDDEAISQLWTRRSLEIARLCLFFSFCGIIVPLVLVFSLGVRTQMLV
jgi:hypothetical protein